MAANARLNGALPTQLDMLDDQMAKLTAEHRLLEKAKHTADILKWVLSLIRSWGHRSAQELGGSQICLGSELAETGHVEIMRRTLIKESKAKTNRRSYSARLIISPEVPSLCAAVPSTTALPSLELLRIEAHAQPHPGAHHESITNSVKSLSMFHMAGLDGRLAAEITYLAALAAIHDEEALATFPASTEESADSTTLQGVHIQAVPMSLSSSIPSWSAPHTSPLSGGCVLSPQEIAARLCNLPRSSAGDQATAAYEASRLPRPHNVQLCVPVTAVGFVGIELSAISTAPCARARALEDAQSTHAHLQHIGSQEGVHTIHLSPLHMDDLPPEASEAAAGKDVHWQVLVTKVQVCVHPTNAGVDHTRLQALLKEVLGGVMGSLAGQWGHPSAYSLLPTVHVAAARGHVPRAPGDHGGD